MLFFTINPLTPFIEELECKYRMPPCVLNRATTPEDLAKFDN